LVRSGKTSQAHSEHVFLSSIRISHKQTKKHNSSMARFCTINRGSSSDITLSVICLFVTLTMTLCVGQHSVRAAVWDLPFTLPASFSLRTTTANYTQKVPYNFIKAIDVGMAEMDKGAKWKNLFSALGIPFNVPDCTSKFGTDYPPNPFTGRKVLNICYEQPADAWSFIFKGAGDYLVETLNTKYGISLVPNHIILDTTKLGYFDTMQDAVDSGKCDVVTSDVITTAARAARVNMQCPYGSSSLAMLRSGLNNSLFTTAQSLNSSNAIIVVFGGTYFETVARLQFPSATLLLTNNC